MFGVCILRLSGYTWKSSTEDVEAALVPLRIGMWDCNCLQIGSNGINRWRIIAKLVSFQLLSSFFFIHNFLLFFSSLCFYLCGMWGFLTVYSLCPPTFQNPDLSLPFSIQFLRFHYSSSSWSCFHLWWLQLLLHQSY